MKSCALLCVRKCSCVARLHDFPMLLKTVPMMSSLRISNRKVAQAGFRTGSYFLQAIESGLDVGWMPFVTGDYGTIWKTVPPPLPPCSVVP
jgi:hypothetical protein